MNRIELIGCVTNIYFLKENQWIEYYSSRIGGYMLIPIHRDLLELEPRLPSRLSSRDRFLSLCFELLPLLLCLSRLLSLWCRSRPLFDGLEIRMEMIYIITLHQFMYTILNAKWSHTLTQTRIIKGQWYKSHRTEFIWRTNFDEWWLLVLCTFFVIVSNGLIVVV